MREMFFLKFLKKNKVYGKFVVNVGSKRDELFENAEPEKWLSSAFVWEDTEDGRDFWNKIDEKWQLILLKQKEQLDALKRMAHSYDWEGIKEDFFAYADAYLCEMDLTEAAPMQDYEMEAFFIGYLNENL